MAKKAPSNEAQMYQIEVKRHLVAHSFKPSDGWEVTVHLDPMEVANGGSHRPNKAAIARDCREWLKRKGVTESKHKEYGLADFVAVHPVHGTHVIEVEGDSSRQPSSAFYSAVSQVLTVMGDFPKRVSYGVAFPNTSRWERQAEKLSPEVRRRLNLSIWFVSGSVCRTIRPV